METAARLVPQQTAPVFSPEVAADYSDTESIPMAPFKLALLRQANHYRPGIDDDGHKLAYAFRGGGLKGISNAAKAEVLHKYQPDSNGPTLLQVPDIMVGDSVGVLVAASAISEQAHLTPRGFELVALKNFINYRNVAHRKPVVGLNMLREYVEGSFDVDAIFDSPIELSFPVANLKTMQTEMFSTKDGSMSRDEFMDRMFQGMHLPILAGKPKDGMADGGLLIDSTEKLAVEAGATDVIGFSNTPEQPCGEMSGMIMRAVGLWIQKYGGAPHLGGVRGYHRHIREQTNFLRTLSDGSYAARNSVNLDMVYPAGIEDSAGMVERDPRRIMNSYIAGLNSVRGRLNLPLVVYEPVPEARSPLATFAKQAKDLYDNAITPNVDVAAA